MFSLSIVLCAGVLFPVSDDPFAGRTPDEVDPSMARGASKSGSVKTDSQLDSVLERTKNFETSHARMMLLIRVRESAMSGIDLPPNDRAELEKFRKKTPVDTGGVGAVQAVLAGVNGAVKAPEAPDVPKTPEEFDRRVRAWLEAEVGTEKLLAELSKKIAMGRASETDRRAHDILSDSQAKAFQKWMQRIQELERDYDLDYPKP